MSNISIDDDHFHDECAVVGVWGNHEASKLCYLGLYALQHRGQEGAGIVTWDGSNLCAHKDMGLVADVFNEGRLAQLPGNVAIGHTRYATCGSKDRQNLQPLLANTLNRSFAIAHNGNLINAIEVREDLERLGAIFSSTSDTETVLHLIARSTGHRTFSESVAKALERVRGAYSLVILAGDSLVGVRDPHGVRPLSLARLDDGYVFASETVAFDLIGAKFIRDVEPGEIVEILPDGTIQSRFLAAPRENAFCVFEHIYFARPDSVLGGRSVYGVRKRLGAELAKEFSAEIDVVVPVPDSGTPAAIGFAQELGKPCEFGLIRNHYVGRTFIEPQQSIRDFGVKIKLNPNSEVLRGKRVCLVDDSIVRGTTCKKIISLVRAAGATEVHFRVSSPPTREPCFYGIDTPTRSELVANRFSVEGIREFIDADSLGYLSMEGMYRAVGDSRSNFCDACFSGNYRLGAMRDSRAAGGKMVEMPRRTRQ